MLSKIPSAMARAISSNRLSKSSLSASVLINPTSTSTAGIFVLFNTTRFGLSFTPRFTNPTCTNQALMLYAILAAAP